MKALIMVVLISVISLPIYICAKDFKMHVSDSELESFMEQWSTDKAFQMPMDPKHDSLLLAALKKDPKGPWTMYLSMKFAQTQFEARSLSSVDRATLYAKSLRYLSPAFDMLSLAVKENPKNKELQHNLIQIEKHVALASLEAGLDLNLVTKIAESILPKTGDLQSWNYGNLLYNGHMLLGRVAIRKENLDLAKKHLLLAGHIPGSPQLNSYGPSFILARELAEKGEYDTVIHFLDLVARFWANPDERTSSHSKRVANDNLRLLKSWKEQLRKGKIPEHQKWR